MSYATKIKTEVMKIIGNDTEGEISKEDLFELASFFAGMSRIFLRGYKKVDPEGYEFLKNAKGEIHGEKN